ncbi:hypothetical protein C8Q79DRAFT_615840 [Trametes meyenii]|nr:hypothetical protein C8Q79DRAFT_615840 [Trametes meyenii]
MPLVRCMFFDNDGVPIGRGCLKGGGCNFIHPSDPLWDGATKSRHVPYASKPKGPSFNPPDRHDRGWDPPRAARDDRRGGDERGSDARGRRGDAPPTAPRRDRQDSGWGKGQFGGSAFGEDAGGAGAGAAPKEIAWGAGSTASSSAAAPPLAAMDTWGDNWGNPNVSWGDPPAGDWGNATAEPAGNGSTGPPAPIRWGEPTATQKSPDGKGGAVKISWGESTKGKEPEAAPTPTWATPRTPRSPQRSPQREYAQSTDPRRRPPMNLPPARKLSGIAAAPMSASEEVTLDLLAKDGPREERRTLSCGVSAPIAVAGPSGSSSSKPNPFTFPAYNPPERMTGITTDATESPIREINMAEGASDSSRMGSRAQSRAGSPVPPSPLDERSPSTLSQWQNYVRTLTRAVSLSIELHELKETRARQRQLQHSQAFKSASLVVAHARIDNVRKEHEAKLRRTEKRYEDSVGRLSQFPQDGPSGTADPAVPPEVQNVEQWAEGVNAWVESVRPIVQRYEEAVRAAIQARAEREAAADAEAKQHEEARSRSKTVLERVENLEETMTDLEHEMEDLRTNGPPLEDIISNVLSRVEQQLGIRLSEPGTDGRRSQSSTEEGEVRAERRPLRQTEAEVAEECARLERALGACAESQATTARLVEEQKARNVAKDFAYHQLAADHAQMQMQLAEVLEQHKTTRATIEANRSELDALQRVLQEYKNQEPPPPPPPMTFDELAAHILPLLRPELHAALQEGLGAVRGGVDAALAKSQEQLCAQILAVARPAIRLIQTVKTMADRQPEILMPPPPPPVQSVHHS